MSIVEVGATGMVLIEGELVNQRIVGIDGGLGRVGDRLRCISASRGRER